MRYGHQALRLMQKIKAQRFCAARPYLYPVAPQGDQAAEQRTQENRDAAVHRVVRKVELVAALGLG